ncbi:MAG: signal peptidase [Solirubrobacteraceae bacterium]|nr:signal peptidase [Solirubrobacteraceae bacterium]
MSAVALPQTSAQRRTAWADRGLTALLVALGIALALGLGLRLFGLTALVDYTDSMRPAIAAGDVILDESVRAADLRPGQIASIPDPGFSGRLVTHRVVSATTAGGRTTIVTRGDSNDVTERWILAADTSTKRMVARIPWVGHVMVWMGSGFLRAVLLALGAVCMLGYGVRIWRPRS